MGRDRIFAIKRGKESCDEVIRRVPMPEEIEKIRREVEREYRTGKRQPKIVV